MVVFSKKVILKSQEETDNNINKFDKYRLMEIHNFSLFSTQKTRKMRDVKYSGRGLLVHSVLCFPCEFQF